MRPGGIEPSFFVPKTNALSVELRALVPKLLYNYTLMSDINQQIAEVEKELRELPHHKATDHHIGRLRAKLARLKDRQYESGSKQGGGGGGYSVKKQGDATIVLIGPPSAGKSTLINLLTNAQSKVAPYAFTTVSVIPGMMKYKDAHIQILDVPGLIEGAEEGKGRGREVLSVARGADLLLIMSDPRREAAIVRIVAALEKNGIRVNKEPPQVDIDKKTGGGLAIHSNIKQDLSAETIREIAKEFGIKNGDITIKEKLDMERCIDAFSSNRVYIPALFVVNKSDTQKKAKDNYIHISAQTKAGVDSLLQEIWTRLNFVRVYLDDDEPMIMRKGQTLRNLTEKIGTEFVQTHSKGKVWGPGSKFPGQEVSLSAQVVDGMKVKFI